MPLTCWSKRFRNRVTFHVQQRCRSQGGDCPNKNTGERVSFCPKNDAKSTQMYWFACKIAI